MAEAGNLADRQGFIDWMKAVGMVLIVIGHVVGAPDALFNSVSQPVYSKQLGVAFFVFATGWSLANDTRPRLRAAFNRVFPVYLFGVICAVALSAIYMVTRQDPAESNYLPLLLGSNVLFNFFPANPTTWYIGTYLHLLLFWYWLAPNRVTVLHLVLALLVEVVVRALLIGAGKGFIGYMLLTNWLSVFLLGQYLRQSTDQRQVLQALAIALGWLVILTLWPMLSALPSLDNAFPIRLPVERSLIGLLLVSVAVSGVYLVNTLLAFQCFRRLPANGLVRFVARNSLLIFILHMPLIYALSGPVTATISPAWLSRTALILLMVFGIGAFSELVHRLINLKAWRDLVWTGLGRLPWVSDRLH